MKRTVPFLLLLLAATACKDGEPEDTGEVPVVTDEDGDGEDALVHGGSDCDDTDSAIHTAAVEICDGLDNDCDGTTDQDAVDALTFYADVDADGYGLESSTMLACEVPDGFSDVAGDCDDGDLGAFPGNAEICDEVDNNCNGRIDEPGAEDETTWYTDNDGDGYGDPEYSTAACIQPAGYVDNAEDCNDVFSDVSPDAIEYCDGMDNNCDGSVDEDTAADTLVFYIDGDADGYGTGDTTAVACSAPSGYSDNASDCDDSDSSVNPGGIEVCGDTLDNDCSGDADGSDASDALTKYPDADGDGYGATVGETTACDFASGTVWVAEGGDCAPGNSAVSPGAQEICDGSTDENCDGSIDEDTAFDAATWYLDADGDGYGVLGSTSVACNQPSGYVEESTDCDDSSSEISPNALETCGNSTDDDCDGVTDECALAGSLSASDAGAVFEAGAAYDFLGVSSLVVDVNGDGYDDVLQGANYADDYGSNGGALYLWHGPVSGAQSSSAADSDYGVDSAARFGESVAALGDEDADGYLDLVLGAPGYDDSYENGGAIWLSQGPTSGSGDLSAQAPFLLGSASEDQLGVALASGDLDDDGNLDLLVGASGTTYGSVYLFIGPLSGSSTTSAADAEYTGSSSASGAGAGIAVADFDGDGADDLLYGGAADSADKGSGSSAGSAFLEYGPITSSGGSASYALYGAASGDGAGSSVAGGDLDGDGYDDLIVGASGASSSTGAIYVVLGPLTASEDLASADITFTGAASGDQAGVSIAVGDSDGDGSADLVMGADYDDTSVSNGGAAYLFYGPFTAGTASLSSADAEISGGNSNARAGSSMAFGDVDNDGYDDLLLGASRQTVTYSYGGAGLLMMGDQR
ncbi:MAG: hypothetical protein ACI9VR_002433 [Cognaticolwellia sp.]|jgi:hypothetical protein